jgi:oxazoline/thiazoline synthase
MYRLSEAYCVTPLNGAGVMLSGKEGTMKIDAQAPSRLLRELSTGPKSWDYLGLLDAPLSEILSALVALMAKGIIEEGEARLPKGHTAFWIEMGLDPLRVAAVLQANSIQIVGWGGDTTILEAACKMAGLTLGASPTLTLVLVDDYRSKVLQAMNESALRSGTPWLLLKTTASQPWVGPLFTPAGAGKPCWECLRHRLELHDQAGSYLRRVNGPEARLEKPFVFHPAAEQMAVQSAVIEIIRWLVDPASSSLTAGMKELSLTEGPRLHHVVRRPQCPACGDRDACRMPPKPIELRPQQILPEVTGGYRSQPAVETLQRLMHHVSPLTGVVPYLRPYRELPGVPVFNYSSGRNMALECRSAFWQDLHNRSANGGKGVNEVQAKAGALCEALERYAAMYHGDPHSVSACFEELPQAVHPADCLLFSRQQYLEREAINARAPNFHSLVPVPFSTQERIPWTPVYSLTSQNTKYLPACYCYAQYPVEDETRMLAYPDSNGCAAGNNLEEAILQGFLELVERDAAAIWWYNQIQRPQVDLGSSGSAYLKTIVDYYIGLRRSLYVLDLTTDLEIPVFVAVSHNMDADSSDEILYAFGGHLDPHIALERAVVELNQMLPLVMGGGTAYNVKDPLFRDWLIHARLKDKPYLQPAPDILRSTRHDFAAPSHSTLDEAIKDCIQRAERSGLEILVLDLTLPDIGLPVAKVVCPGLRHFWRRTAPGRLYDVPVQMGWLDRPNQEDELNSDSILI